MSEATDGMLGGHTILPEGHWGVSLGSYRRVSLPEGRELMFITDVRYFI